MKDAKSKDFLVSHEVTLSNQNNVNILQENSLLMYAEFTGVMVYVQSPACL